MKKTLVCMIVLAMMLGVMLIPAVADEATWEPCGATEDGLHIGICDAEGKCGWCGKEGIPAEGFSRVDHKYTGDDEYYHHAVFAYSTQGHMAIRHCEYCDATVVEELREHGYKDGVCECGYAEGSELAWEECPYNNGLHIGICDAEGDCGWCGKKGIPAEGFKQIDHKYTGDDEYYHHATWTFTEEGHIATRHCEYCDATVVEEMRAHNLVDGVCECGYEESGEPEVPATPLMEITMNFVDCKADDQVTLIFGDVFGADYAGQTLTFTADDNVKDLSIPKKDLSWMFGAAQSTYFTINAPEGYTVTSEFVDGDGNDPSTKGHATFTVTGLGADVPATPLMEITMNFVDCKDGDQVTLIFGNVFGDEYAGQTLVFTADDNVKDLSIPKKDLSWMFGDAQSTYFTIEAPEGYTVTSEFVDGDGNDPSTKGHATFTVTGLGEPTFEPCTATEDGLHIGICDTEGKCGWCGKEGIPAEGFSRVDHKYTGDDEYYKRPTWESSAEGHIATRHCEYCDETVVEELREHNFVDGVCECGYEDEAAKTGDITVSVLAGMMALAAVGAAVVIKKRG